MNARRLLLAAAALFASLVAAPTASAGADATPAAWHHTGDGVMTKEVAFITVDVFAVGHDMRCLPEHKSRELVIEADCDKRLVWVALRDVDKDAIHDALRKAYRSVDYARTSKIERAIAAFADDIKQGARITIAYDAAAKAVSLRADHGKPVVIEGEDFMKATWRVLFGPQASELGDDLIAKL